MSLVLAKKAELAAAQALHNRRLVPWQQLLCSLQLGVTPSPPIRDVAAVREWTKLELRPPTTVRLLRYPLVADEALVLVCMLTGKT